MVRMRAPCNRAGLTCWKPVNTEACPWPKGISSSPRQSTWRKIVHREPGTQTHRHGIAMPAMLAMLVALDNGQFTQTIIKELTYARTPASRRFHEALQSPARALPIED